MLDVHPAHHAATTWRDFLIHIATICVGLLIAVGLEQAVEAIHHRHQLEALREALDAERRYNIVRFHTTTREFERLAPILQGTLQTLVYLRQHPQAPQAQWPGRFSYYIMLTQFEESTWKTAQQTAVLESMPQSERSLNAAVYSYLEGIDEASAAELQALFRAKAYMTQFPDPAAMTKEENEHAYDLFSDYARAVYVLGLKQRLLSTAFPEFSGPPSTDLNWRLIPPAPDPRDTQAAAEILKAEHDELAAHGLSQPQP